MTSRRVRQLARELDLPARTLLDRIKRDVPSIPLDSIMSYVTDEDLPRIIEALATKEPRHVLAGTPHEAMASQMRQEYDEARERAERAARIEREVAEARERAERERPPDFRDFRLPPEERWQAFQALLRKLDTITSSASNHESQGEVILELEEIQIKRAVRPEPWASVMARRRLATSEIGATSRKFSWDMLEDVSLLDLDSRTHEGLCHADPDTIARIRANCAVYFPIDIDWEYASRYILNYIQADSAPEPRSITREAMRAELRTDDKLTEELQAAVDFEEISAEQFARIQPWLRGEGEVEYDWLRALLDDDYLTYSAALSFEQRRADEVMLAHTIEHVFGIEEDAPAWAIQLNDENENTRYRFMLYAGEGGVASAIISFEL